jgi:hypothetical protein
MSQFLEWLEAEYLTGGNSYIIMLIIVAFFVVLVAVKLRSFLKKSDLQVLFVCRGSCEGLYDPAALECLRRGGIQNQFCVNCAPRAKSVGWC